ncbi:MAG TPA: putative baseplate assembly protein, partial [Actinomycetota bacterium]
EGSVVLDVEEVSGWVTWSPVEGFWASAEHDRHYVLDAEAGTVRFGNGIQGKAPQIGERIRARGYCFGGGAQGNVAAGAISKLDGAPAGVKVSNPFPAHDGAPAETITAALDRLPGELRRRDRAVTPSDFQELALATPGGRVGRAESLPLFHPANPGVQAAGVVSVMVWPREDLRHPAAPMPERTLLSEVCSWLDARRLVTAELYVIPPTYHKVSVSVGLEAKDGFGVEALRRWVELVIRQYLAPLPPFGPDGNGWPLGRRVYGPELEAAALQVEGIDFLRGLRVAGLGSDGTWVTGTVDLLPYEVPELAEITVVAGMDPLPPGVPLGPPPTPSVPVPIPVVKETC